MQVRIFLSPGHDDIDETFKHTALVGAVEGPCCGVFGLGAVIQRDVAKKVFDSSVFNERIGFEVEEDVPGRWLRKTGQTSLRFGGKQLKNRLARLAILQLKAGLLMRLRKAGQCVD